MVVVFGLVATLSAALDDLCAGKPQNSFIAFPGDCEKYILCQNERALPDRCDQSRGETWFDPNRSACAPPGDFCAGAPCRGRSRVFVADPSSDCGGWIFCLDGEPSHNDICPYNLTFQPETQYCTYPVCAAATSEASTPRATPHVLL